jgi:hypothetical protein
MIFSKENLLGNYNWTFDPISPLFTGFPTRRIFDRLNGKQVLFLINCFARLSNCFSLEEGRAIENLILNHLPQNAQSEKTAYNWLKSNK